MVKVALPCDTFYFFRIFSKDVCIALEKKSFIMDKFRYNLTEIQLFKVRRFLDFHHVYPNIVNSFFCDLTQFLNYKDILINF